MNNLQRLSTSAVSVQDSLQAKADLNWIADRWGDLQARLVPSTTPNQGGSRPAPTSRPPLNLHVSNLLFEIEQEARMLGHVLSEEVPGGWQPRSSAMPQLLRDVAEYHGHWTTQPDHVSVPFVEWATDYRHRVTRALENPPNPQYVGPCPTCPPGQGDLYVTPRTRLAKCRNCRQTIDIQQQMQYVQQHLENRLMTLTEIRTALTILEIPHNYATIRKWAERKRLVPETGNLYKLTHAIQLAQGNK
ncbi:MAG TPA: hypothetical protein VK054_04175 [Beutenbergiaceae bacterium]|nr:hypothetical protein [Beutenbergiaceae bacterium]